MSSSVLLWGFGLISSSFRGRGQARIDDPDPIASFSVYYNAQFSSERAPACHCALVCCNWLLGDASRMLASCAAFSKPLVDGLKPAQFQRVAGDACAGLRHSDAGMWIEVRHGGSLDGLPPGGAG